MKDAERHMVASTQFFLRKEHTIQQASVNKATQATTQECETSSWNEACGEQRKMNEINEEKRINVESCL